jgi:hypothetical protein
MVACSADLPLEQRSCASGTSCVPGAAGFAACIWRSGKVACPPGPYSQQATAVSGADDTRGCSCVCDYDVVPCTWAMDINDAGTCTNFTSYSTPQPCLKVPNIAERITTASTGGSFHCAPTQVFSTGAATTVGPMTFCCAQ